MSSSCCLERRKNNVVFERFRETRRANFVWNLISRNSLGSEIGDRGLEIGDRRSEIGDRKVLDSFLEGLETIMAYFHHIKTDERGITFKGFGGSPTDCYFLTL